MRKFLTDGIEHFQNAVATGRQWPIERTILPFRRSYNCASSTREPEL